MRASIPGTIHNSHDDAAALDALRPYLFSIAYRMLGSASDAEDIVQEAFVRYFAGTPASVTSPKAFLSTVVTRLCLDHLKSARVTREQYPGPWLPEPALTADVTPGPEEQAERGDDVSIAFLVLLERLSPDERAAFVLREAFNYPYDEIAAIVGKSNAASRKLVQRARQRITSRHEQPRAAFDDQRRLTERFLAAARDGDLEALTETLAEDVTIWVDGGQEVSAARHPVRGGMRVARFVMSWLNTVYPDALLTTEDVNGETGILLWNDGALVSVSTAVFAGDTITELRTIVNPRKLDHLRRRATPPDTPSS